MFFASCGFALTEFARMKVGPLAMKDDLEYRREVHLHDEIRATMVLRGLAGDGSRIVWRNDFDRRDVLATRVHTLSAWLDLTQRKLVAPPAGVVEALRALPHTDDFQVLPTLGEK